jgi:hypothetical protein
MTIEERLANVEQELGRAKRRNRLLLGAILLVAGGLIIPAVFETTAFRARAQATGTAKEIHANAFILEDQNGKTRARLFADRYGPELILADENGKSRVRLTVDEFNATLVLSDENGKPRAQLDADNDGATLGLSDENGKSHASLSMFNDGPVLTLYDEKGNARLVAGMTHTLMPDGKTITYPESSLVLFGPDGKVIWSAIK